MPKRTDSNHKKIIDFVRSIPGASVFSTHEVGRGFPDIVVGYRGINYLFEIKDGSKPPSQRKLTESEVKFHSTWSGSLHIINSVDDVLVALNK